MPEFLKSYKELSRLKTFEEKYNYLRLKGSVGKETFGFDRYLNQVLYTSTEWRRFRQSVIIRDNGCDLGDPDHVILKDRIIIHHINPLTIEDIKERSSKIFDMDNVICVSNTTHQAIHYGDEGIIPTSIINERKPNDTCPWKIQKGGSTNE